MKGTTMYKAMIMVCMLGTFNNPDTCNTFEDSYMPSTDYNKCITRATEMMFDIQEMFNTPNSYYFQCVELNSA